VKKIKFGLVGTGLWCQNAHVTNLKLLPEAEIVAVYNRGEENLKKALSLIGGNPKVCEAPAEVYDQPDVDAVVVSLPPHLNREIVTAALKKGKHVFCEKPLSNTLEGCRAIVEEAQRTKLVLQIGIQMPYSQLFGKVRDIIEGGGIGSPQMCWFRSFSAVGWAYRTGKWVTDPELSGGVMNSWGVHPFCTLNLLARAKPKSVTGVGGVRVRKDTPENVDSAWVIMTYKNGVTACLEYCRFSPYGNEWQLGVIGDEGKIEALFESRIVKQFGIVDSTETRYILPPQTGGLYTPGGGDGCKQQLESFIRCVKTGEKPRVDGKVATEATAVALAAERSIKEGLPIKVEV